VQTAPEFRASTRAGDQYNSSITTLSDGGYVVAQEPVAVSGA
jgi:hypothetical protein